MQSIPTLLTPHTFSYTHLTHTRLPNLHTSTHTPTKPTHLPSPHTYQAHTPTKPTHLPDPHTYPNHTPTQPTHLPNPYTKLSTASASLYSCNVSEEERVDVLWQKKIYKDYDKNIRPADLKVYFIHDHPILHRYVSLLSLFYYYCRVFFIFLL